MKVKLSGSFRRYRVDSSSCELDPDPLQGDLPAALYEHRFRSIDGSSRQMRSVGWTAPDGLVPADFAEFDPWLGPMLQLGVRMDVKRIPGGALRIRKAEWEAAERRESGERIAPDRRREMAEKLESELLSRCVPSTAIYTMLWDTESGSMLFSATADAVNAAFRSLFRETFGRVAEVVDASGAAARFAAAQGREDALLGALPQHLL